ncbi:MAG: hypothetical protein NTX50_00050, partial [Candidatus Sumerlaeota bacterium]|nr:hypothetical protein [Candidatus Sumerlaeota bacterium]
ICFISTRCEFGILCDAPDLFTGTVLYRMDADGKNMTKLTNSSVSEASPCVMNDGRIMYTRWEYVDKGAVSVKCLWAMHPDGSGSVEVFGNDIALPPSLLHGRPIPDSSNLFVLLGTPHYPQSGVGTVIRIDVNYPIRTRQPMTYITPDIDIRAEGGFHFNRNGRWIQGNNGPLFADAFPLSDKFFLVSHNPDKPWNDTKAWGLYLLDEFGNRALIYRDPEISCWQPTPLRLRPIPPMIPSALPQPNQSAQSDRSDPSDASDRSEKASRAGAGKEPCGTLIMSDVYGGLYDVPKGTIKFLRVLEQVPRPWSARKPGTEECYDQQHAVISKDTHLGLKVLHGVVPVEEDGSAYFTIPADKNIFLEALDENYMEIQRMRTYVNLRPGETRSCIGCHEQREWAPAVKPAAALRHAPVAPSPQPGDSGPRPIDYVADIQPILDKHCISCHSGAAAKGKLELTGEMTTFFNRSYENILARKLVTTIGENHPKTGNVDLVAPKSLGSHNSKLVSIVLKGNKEYKLTREELIRLFTWVDTNAQYYGSYFGRRNLKNKNLPDFRPVPTLASALGTPPGQP